MSGGGLKGMRKLVLIEICIWKIASLASLAPLPLFLRVNFKTFFQTIWWVFWGCGFPQFWFLFSCHFTISAKIIEKFYTRYDHQSVPFKARFSILKYQFTSICIHLHPFQLYKSLFIRWLQVWTNLNGDSWSSWTIFWGIWFLLKMFSWFPDSLIYLSDRILSSIS